MMSQSVFHAHYWRDCARLTTQKLCVMGVLMALQIILSRITAINLGNWLRISFGFLPNAIAGYLLGPIGGTLVARGGATPSAPSSPGRRLTPVCPWRRRSAASSTG